MRLFDKVASMGPPHIKQLIRDHGSHMQVLAVDSVAANYYLNKQQMWSAEDYPFAVSPWTQCFVEWNESTEIYLENGIERNDKPAQLGCFVTMSPTNDKAPGALKRFVSVACQKDIAIDPETKRIAIINPVSYSLGRLDVWKAAIVVTMTYDGYVLNTLFMGESFKQLYDAAGEEGAKRFGNTYCHIIFLSFTFANCRNVKLQDVTDDLQPEPKIRRRLKIPDVKRYTLNICGHYTKPSRSVNEPQQGVMPFHLCRGHFATYTADKPMFGNPKLVGRYWHPPHMRGKKENGVIEKDYAIAGD